MVKFRKLMEWVGIALILEALFLQVDFTQYGIPSIFVFGYHIHHWIIGAGLILWYLGTR